MPATLAAEKPRTKQKRWTIRSLALLTGIEEMTARLSFKERLTDDQIVRFCQRNPVLRVEQAANGDLLIMPPAHSETGQQNAELIIDFGIWARADGTGKVFDSSAGFRLPNGALRAPDVSWVFQTRIDQLPKVNKKGFVALCPDFVLEMRSHSDHLPVLQEKMAEYLACGVGLGWLIDPPEKQIFIYRPDQPAERLDAPVTLSGEPVLAGFTLDLARVW